MSASTDEPTDVVYDINDVEYEDVLADIRERYNDPLEAFPYDDATELVNAAQALEAGEPDKQDRAEFEGMLEDVDEEYIHSWWTHEENGEVVFYGAMRDPDNEDAWINRQADEDDPFISEETGYR